MMVRGTKRSAALQLLRVTAFGLLLSCWRAATADVQIPPFQRVQLENGTVLLLMERHDVPLVAFRALVRGGALTDPAGQSGMSSLLANLLEKGAGQRDAYTFANAIASVGGSIAAYADTESIGISGSFLARDATLMVELLSDMLERPQLQREELATLRARQIEFIRAAKDSDLGSLAAIYGQAALFQNHLYGRPTVGSEADLATITHEDVRNHYRDYLGGDRLIVAVAGDFDTGRLAGQLKSALATWRKAQAPLPTVEAPSPAAPRVLLIDAPGSVQSYFWLGSLGVAKGFPDRAALDVVNTLFGGRFTSMLNSKLRIESGLTYGAQSSFERFTQPGAWQMSSFTQTETTAEAIDASLETLEALHVNALDPELLVSGRSYRLGQYPLAFETAAQWAAALADLEFYELDRSYIDGYGAALQAVTAQDARRMIDERFPLRKQLTMVVIGNAAKIRDSLRRYGPLAEMRLSDPSFTLPAKR